VLAGKKGVGRKRVGLTSAKKEEVEIFSRNNAEEEGKYLFALVEEG